MKTLGLLLLFAAQSAQAVFNEFECDFSTRDGLRVRLEVQQTYRSSSSTGARMRISGGDGDQNLDFNVTRRMRGARRIEYWGADFRLEVDLWPDEVPRRGREYTSRLETWSVDPSRNVYTIRCDYAGV